MKAFLALACAAVALTGCATQDQQAFYKDIQGCERTYKGSIQAGVLTGGAFNGAVDIHCDPLAITRANAAKIKTDAAVK